MLLYYGRSLDQKMISAANETSQVQYKPNEEKIKMILYYTST